MKYLAHLSGITLAVIVLGLSMPYGVPLVSCLLMLQVFLGVSIAITTKKIPNVFLPRELVLVIFFAVFFILWGSFLSRALYGEVRVDLSNILSLAIASPFFLAIIQSNCFSYLRGTFVRSCAWGGFLVSLVCLYKFKLLLSGEQFWWVEIWLGNKPYPWGTSLQPDYNMCALGLTISLLCLIKGFLDCPSLMGKFLRFSSALIVLISVVLTGSRRGAVVLLMFAVVGLLYGFYRFINGFLVQKLNAMSFKGLMAGFLVLFTIFGTGMLWKGFGMDYLQGGEFRRLMRRFDTMRHFGATLIKSRSDPLEVGLKTAQRSSPQAFLIGGGFDYLSTMSPSSMEVYPHNPLVSALLYGGLPALFFTLYVLLRGLFIWVRLFVEERLLAVVFFVLNLFCFISSNSYFSIKLGCFMLAIGMILVHNKKLSIQGNKQ